METADLDTVIEEVEGKRKVVDKMVHRYLIHTRIDQSERAKLYGLALLRRANQPAAVSAALDLTSEEAKTGYPATLSRLQRRYSFIFTEKEEPSLHQEVRHFLRLWLLQHYKEPHIQAINEPLKEAHEAALKKLEELRHYASLKERLQDDEWVGIYLDLAQQQFWIDPVEGMRYLLPFMIAAAIYYRTINEEARRVGQFFVKEMKHPYLSWWRWADKCLKLPSNFDPMDEELVALEQLTELASQRCLTFPSPIPDCRKELEAALWWRLGEAYELIDAYQALRWYEIALACLGHEIRLKESASRVCHMIGDQLEEEKKYSESISFFDRAITLNSDDFFTYYSRGLLHAKLGNLSQAIQDFERIIALRTKDAFAYLCRGYAYDDLGDYSTAMQDFERALALDPDNASGYYHRGVIHAKLGNYSSAIQDYDRALDLESDYANVYIGRGIAYADLQDYPRAIQDYNRAISLNPDEPVAYYNRSYAFLLIKDLQRAQSDFSFYSRLNPTDINAAWMTQWLGMGKTRPTVEMVEHLEKVEEIDPETYVAYVCQGLVLGLRGKLKEGLAKLEQALSLDSEAWDAYFWQGMLLAHYYKGRYEKARKALEKALELEMPPVLLTPLYWLEKERSDFFEQYARPLLEYYQV